MKNMVIRGALLLCLLSLMIACSPKKEGSEATVVDTAQIKKEIQAKENEFAAGYNARELRNIGYYADDATSFSQNRAPLIGKQAIVEYYQSNIDSIPKSNIISFTTNEVFVSNNGNQVVEIGYYKVINAANSIVNSGNYMSLFVKRDGKYVSLRDMSTSDRPL